eukprot:7296664-Prymnesium_polylepis.1
MPGPRFAAHSRIRTDNLHKFAPLRGEYNIVPWRECASCRLHVTRPVMGVGICVLRRQPSPVHVARISYSFDPPLRSQELGE